MTVQDSLNGKKNEKQSGKHVTKEGHIPQPVAVATGCN